MKKPKKRQSNAAGRKRKACYSKNVLQCIRNQVFLMRLKDNAVKIGDYDAARGFRRLLDDEIAREMELRKNPAQPHKLKK